MSRAFSGLLAHGGLRYSMAKPDADSFFETSTAVESVLTAGNYTHCLYHKPTKGIPRVVRRHYVLVEVKGDSKKEDME